jgi:hypothetical protein
LCSRIDSGHKEGRSEGPLDLSLPKSENAERSENCQAHTYKSNPSPAISFLSLNGRVIADIISLWRHGCILIDSIVNLRIHKKVLRLSYLPSTIFFIANLLLVAGKVGQCQFVANAAFFQSCVSYSIKSLSSIITLSKAVRVITNFPLPSKLSRTSNGRILFSGLCLSAVYGILRLLSGLRWSLRVHSY